VPSKRASKDAITVIVVGLKPIDERAPEHKVSSKFKENKRDNKLEIRMSNYSKVEGSM